MKYMIRLFWLSIIGLGFIACANESISTPQATDTNVSTEPTPSDPNPFPLSEPGPYLAGYREVTAVDESRGGREITFSIWYPLQEESELSGEEKSSIHEPDARYPIIMTGRNSGTRLYKSHLASYGFVMVIVRSPGFSYEAPWNNSVIDGPLDFMFVLDVLSSNPPDGLEGILDTDRVGVAGYSSDGLFSLALGGARISPEYYFSQCSQAATLDPPLSSDLVEYFCLLSGRWDEFSSQVDPEISKISEGLWQPTTDSRILAIMPMAPDSAWLYGAEGLATITIPSLVIAGTADDLASYKMSSCYIYEHLVNSDRNLISFIGKGHMMVENKEVGMRIKHFTVAFFGHYLQGRDDYAYFFSEDYVKQFEDLAWGVYLKD
jgi:predicted dienelactone hydrolase